MHRGAGQTDCRATHAELFQMKLSTTDAGLDGGDTVNPRHLWRPHFAATAAAAAAAEEIAQVQLCTDLP
jgi:hypothetical protein